MGVGEVGRVGGHERKGGQVEYLYCSATGGWGIARDPTADPATPLAGQV